MPLPHEEWLDIQTGPSLWQAVRNLLREPGERPFLCQFRVIDGKLGIRARAHRLTIEVTTVSRSDFGYSLACVLKGKIREIDGFLADLEFEADYDPQRRQGSFLIRNPAIDPLPSL